ncbi:hypothetical protein [Helicobacter marmotae]|uniref:hypothetical protein n=1 Tax=Helicobacter marmotae TaxID=152490 RepID=UPI0011C02D1D|nr:hypothetical protein [Helicobacter marmotae]
MTTWLPILGEAEELLLVSPKSTTSDSHRDSSPVSQAQNDKISNLQDKITLQRKSTHNKFNHSQRKLTWHHEGKRSGSEESFKESPAIQSSCHSERSEESLSESLVAYRDSSPATQVQNDKITTFF